MRIDVITLFPDMFDLVSRYGINRRALDSGVLQLHTWNPRDYTRDRHRTVDDRPYGGGPGMVMLVEPLRRTLAAARAGGGGGPLIYLSPQGRPLTQQRLRELKSLPAMLLLAGRYEGVDERLLQLEVDEEISLGDYVLSGGELPAMVLIDGLARLLPGVLGNEDSSEQDSFSQGLLDCPHYTRPEEVEGLRVPDVLLSGNHKDIAAWRLKNALGRTWERRKDIIEKMELTKEQQILLAEYRKEHDK